MKLKCDKKYVYIGVTAFLVIVASITFCIVLLKLDVVSSWIKKINKIFTPIYIGIIIAYLVNPICNIIEKFFFNKIFVKLKKQDKRKKWSRVFATIFSALFFLGIITAIICLILPQLSNSISTIYDNFYGYYNRFIHWLDSLGRDTIIPADQLESIFDNLYKMITDWIENSLTPQITNIVAKLGGGIWVVVVFLKDFFIGFIVSIYLLLSKDRFVSQIKKITYSIFKVKHSNFILEKSRYTHKIFSKFITGKILDSAIIGILCFILMAIFRFPFPLLISVIIGITNIIPFFGPIIGAIPGALIILLVDPYKFIYFLIFVLALQQFDGNILGPRILGEVTGLQSFWVLFSLLIGGGLFGIMGMVVSVPVFAVFYSFVNAIVNHLLRKKHLSTNTQSYLTLKSIDEKTNESIDN